jgi:hypothetical protein
MLEDVVVARPTLSMAVGDGCRCRAPRSSEQPLTHNEAAIVNSLDGTAGHSSLVFLMTHCAEQVAGNG